MDDYRPRPHDHLVEPVFGGLALADARRAEERARPRPSLWRRLWRALLRLVRPSRQAPGP
jgi:hypothetical protein